jgi:hypothetical protein
MIVTLSEILPEVVAKELDKFVKLLSSVVSLVLKLALCAAKEEEAAVLVAMFVSSVTNLPDKELEKLLKELVLWKEPEFKPPRSSEFSAREAVPDIDPLVITIVPFTTTLPETVSDPDMVG